MFYKLFTRYTIPYFVLIAGVSFSNVNAAKGDKKLVSYKSYNTHTEYDTVALRNIGLHIIENFPGFICYIPALVSRVSRISSLGEHKSTNEKFLKIEDLEIPGNLRKYLLNERRMFNVRRSARKYRFKKLIILHC